MRRTSQEDPIFDTGIRQGTILMIDILHSNRMPKRSGGDLEIETIYSDAMFDNIY